MRVDIFVALVALLVCIVYAVRTWALVGALEFPLDDTYIYLQYARNLARGYFFEYTPGAGYSSGCTSALYPLLLVPGYWLGLDSGALRNSGMIYYTWVLATTLVMGSAVMASRLGRLLGGEAGAVGASLLLLSTGSWLWGALSGLEIALYTLLILSAGWLLGLDIAAPPDSRSRRALWGVTALIAVVRPEGMPMAAAVAVVIFSRSRPETRLKTGAAWGLAFVPWLMVGLVNLQMTGHFVPNTATTKSAAYFPRQSTENLLGQALKNLRRVGKVLLKLEHQRLVLPLGVITLVVAVGFLLWRIRKENGSRWLPSWLLAVIGLGVGAAVTAQSTGLFTRYYHVVFALCSVTAGAGLGWIFWHWASKLQVRRRTLASGLMCIFALGCVAAHLPGWTQAFARSSGEIHGQQVKMARYIADQLPPSASLLLNDAGAMVWMNERPTYDVCGLVTNGASASFLEGNGSIVERLERLPRASLPTHAAMYRKWFNIDPLLGPELFRATLKGKTLVLGSNIAQLFPLDWTLLGSGEKPAGTGSGGEIVDRLDVADLEDERAHLYQLEVPAPERGRKKTTLLGALPTGALNGPDARRLDGGRLVSGRERFVLKAKDTKGLVIRARFVGPALLSVKVDGKSTGVLGSAGPIDRFWEAELPLPDLNPGAHTFEISPIGRGTNRPEPYQIFHYWLISGATPSSSPSPVQSSTTASGG